MNIEGRWHSMKKGNLIDNLAVMMKNGWMRLKDFPSCGMKLLRRDGKEDESEDLHENTFRCDQKCQKCECVYITNLIISFVINHN